MLEIMFIPIWGIVGIWSFIIGIRSLKYKKEKQRSCTSKTYAKVKELKVYERRRHHYWHPIFEYTVGELKVTNEYIYGSQPPKYKIGEQVEIYYNPKNHDEYYVVGNNSHSVVIIAYIALGIMAIVITIKSVISMF